jgi:hypothetical protein
VDALSWKIVLAAGGSVIAIVGLMAGVAQVLEWAFFDYRENVTRWEPKGVSEDGRTITVEYTTSQCPSNPFDRVERAESSTTVTLTVILRERVGGDCEDVSIHHETEVELDRPLGARRLLDGRIDAPPNFETRTTVPLTIDETVDVSKSSYDDGFVSYVSVYDEQFGAGVLAQRLPAPVATAASTLVSSLTFRIRPGDYRLVSGRLPCRETCESFDPPADRCSAPVSLVPLHSVAVTVNVRPGAGCTMKVVEGD